MRALRMLIALALVAGVSLIGSSAASAQAPGGLLPPELQEVVDEVVATLPPEVQDAVNQAVADALIALMEADVEGVGQAESSPGHSKASAIHVDEVLTLNESETTKESAKVTRLSLLGLDLLVKEGDENGGYNSGELAAIGDAVDEINAALCPGGRSAPGQCVTVLDANANTPADPSATSRTYSANSAVASVRTAEGDGLSVLPNTATTNVTTLPFVGDRCTDVATNGITGGSGTFGVLSIVGLKIALGGVLAAC